MIKSTQKSQRSRFFAMTVSMLVWPPIGAALLLFLTLSSIFSDRHHAGEATRMAPDPNQPGAH